jgi:hypothetical protein
MARKGFTENQEYALKKALKNKIRTIRLTDEQIAALDALAKKLDISGQRGARFQPFIQWLADTSSYALAETAAALEIAAGCAAGEDWNELKETIEPDWPNK